VLHPLFPEMDLGLRQGRHIDRDDGELYGFLLDAQEYLGSFYIRYGCELTHAADGYFYLHPISEQLGRRHMSIGEMLTGQTMALMFLDPSTLQTGGLVHRDHVISRLSGLIGELNLVRALNPRRRGKHNERVAQEIVRSEIAKALRALGSLGFIEIVGDQLHLRAPLLRFAEPVRGVEDPAAALAKLVAGGQVSRRQPGTGRAVLLDRSRYSQSAGTSLEKWGAKVIDRLATDLKRSFPDMKGFSPRNLKYMRAFAEAWPEEPIVQAVLAQITWYHNVAILEKRVTSEDRIWYAKATIQHDWSRNVLVHQIQAGRLRRQGKDSHGAANFGHLPSEYPRRRDVPQPLWYLGNVRKMYTVFGQGSRGICPKYVYEDRTTNAGPARSSSCSQGNHPRPHSAR
jgi:chromosome partition protein MukE